MPPLVTLIGNIASGKTTALPLVGKALDAHVLFADELFQVSPFRDRYLEDTPRWAFSNELWLTEQRYRLTIETLAEHPDETVVIDSGLLMSWVYSYSHVGTGSFSPSEWELYDRLFSHWFSPLQSRMKIIAFNCSTKEKLERIQKRGRDYELSAYTPEYLQQIDTGLEALKTKIKTLGMELHELESEELGDLVDNLVDQQAFISRIQKEI
jgi:deoxyadenosine/deoxycytidine kinase